jgi:hypothetical protein
VRNASYAKRTLLRLVKDKILANRARIVAQLGGQLLAARERVLDALLALKDGPLLRLVRLFVDVFAAFAGLAAQLGVVSGAAGICLP